MRNGLVKPGDIDTLLSRGALIRNILAPISSKRSYGNDVQPPLSENSLNSAPRSTQLAPVSNGAELSVSALSGEYTYDADALFPSDMFDVGVTGLDRQCKSWFKCKNDKLSWFTKCCCIG